MHVHAQVSNNAAESSQWCRLAANFNKGRHCSAATRLQASRPDNAETASPQLRQRTTSRGHSMETADAKTAKSAAKPAIQAVSMRKKGPAASSEGSVSSTQTASDASAASRTEASSRTDGRTSSPIQPRADYEGYIGQPRADHDGYIGQYEMRRQMAEAAGIFLRPQQHVLFARMVWSSCC